MKEFRHTGIVVSDLDKSLYFYGNLLGLKIKKKMDESGNYIDQVINLHNVKITIVKMAADDRNLIELLYFYTPRSKSIRRDICDIGISHIAFTVGNIDQEYKRLSQAGVHFISSSCISPDGFTKVAFCKDPDGNYIELVEVLK